VDDERQQDMGLVLDYNALGLMSNNVSIYTRKLYYVQAVLCTFVLTVYSIYRVTSYRSVSLSCSVDLP